MERRRQGAEIEPELAALADIETVGKKRIRVGDGACGGIEFRDAVAGRKPRKKKS